MDELLGAVLDDVVEKDEALVSLAFVESHLDRIGGEGGGEDMGSGEFIPDVATAGLSCHHLDYDFAVLALGDGSGLLCDAD